MSAVSSKAKTKTEGKPQKPAFKYRERFGLIIELPNEKEQKAAYQQLQKLGFSPRVVNV